MTIDFYRVLAHGEYKKLRFQIESRHLLDLVDLVNRPLLRHDALGSVDGFDQDEACGDCDDGCEILLGLLAS
ncbi:hypothetical protein [Rhizobium herbae]